MRVTVDGLELACLSRWRKITYLPTMYTFTPYMPPVFFTWSGIMDDAESEYIVQTELQFDTSVTHQMYLYLQTPYIRLLALLFQYNVLVNQDCLLM